MQRSTLVVALAGGAVAAVAAVLAYVWPWSDGSGTRSKASEGGTLEGGAETSAGPVDDGRLPPDLVTVPPRQLYVVDDGATRALRFSTTVANIGEGPLDLLGSVDTASGVTTAVQRITRDDGTNESRLAGRFAFHDEHEHWHFEDFTVMEMWTIDEVGGLVDLVASTGKSTFCAIDSETYDQSLPAAAQEPAFGTCGQGVQGISVGWSDTYEAELFGQSLDITGVPDGRYALRCVVDPDDLLVESDDHNNATISYVDLGAGGVGLLDGP